MFDNVNTEFPNGIATNPLLVEVADSTPSVNETVQLTVYTSVGLPRSDVTRFSTFSTSNPRLAIVSSTGLLTTLGAGTVTVTAAYSGRTGTISLPIHSLFDTPWLGDSILTKCDGGFICFASQVGHDWPTGLTLSQSGASVSGNINMQGLNFSVGGSVGTDGTFTGTFNFIGTVATLRLVPGAPGSIPTLTGTWSTVTGAAASISLTECRNPHLIPYPGC